MIMKRYKCRSCFNEMCGPEIDVKKGEGFCLVCGEQGTLQVEDRDWNAEPKDIPSAVPKGTKWPP